MQFHKVISLFILLILLVTFDNIALANTAQAEMGKEKVTVLIKKALPDVPRQNGLMVVVDFLPGQGAIHHKHPGSVFAYVLQGTVISQLEGQKPIIYHQGQYWYEPPMVGHLICKNASNKQHAKLLVWQLVGDKKSPLIPYHPVKKH